MTECLPQIPEPAILPSCTCQILSKTSVHCFCHCSTVIIWPAQHEPHTWVTASSGLQLWGLSCDHRFQAASTAQHSESAQIFTYIQSLNHPAQPLSHWAMAAQHALVISKESLKISSSSNHLLFFFKNQVKRLKVSLSLQYMIFKSSL